ncbi:hypothetical protein QF001_000005 [Paraburkholderia youngii]
MALTCGLQSIGGHGSLDIHIDVERAVQPLLASHGWHVPYGQSQFLVFLVSGNGPNLTNSFSLERRF